MSEKDNNEFTEMLEDYLPEESSGNIRGERVNGIITQKETTYTLLDVPGMPSAVRVKSEELDEYNVGDSVDVILLQEIEDEAETTMIIGSRKRIELEKNLDIIKKAFEEKAILRAKVTRRVKGGYILNILGHQGFLPNSLSEISSREGDGVVGREYDVMIKDFEKDSKRNNTRITLSRRDITIEREKEEFLKLEEGQVVVAKITDVLDFGLSVRVNTLRGFIHISEISWTKIDTLSDLYSKGQEVEAKIIVLDREKRNIKLSIKALSPNPWDEIAPKIVVGDEIKGTVTRIVPYGVFVEVAPGVDGLIHMTDFVWNRKRVNLNDYAQVGDEITTKILEFIPEDRKLKLGLKQLAKNPWADAEENFGVGKVLTARVVEVKDFGLFAEIVPGVDVFVHTSDYTWHGEPNKKFKSGDEISFKVIDLNTDENKIKGSIKATTKSPWDRAMDEYKVGQVVEKEIKNVLDFGMFVNLSEGVDGFIPAQLASKGFIKNLNDEFAPGDVIKAQIIEIDPEKKRIKLSIKKVEIDNERREERELLSKYGTSSTK